MTGTAADRGREVRGRLLAAAAALIAERGWGAVSTRLVADRADVTPGLVHYHFASLPALLAEAALGPMRALVAEATRSLADAPSATEGIRTLLAALDAYDGRDPTSLLFAETYLAATRDDDLRREIGGLVADLRAALARRLAAAGVAQPAETAAVLAAAVDGMILHRALAPGLAGPGVAGVLERLLAGARRPR
jgi:AcrR family transcriptional regulator